MKQLFKKILNLIFKVTICLKIQSLNKMFIQVSEGYLAAKMHMIK